VRDSGPGIAAHDLSRLFQPFSRLNAEGGPIEGSGIGLSLSRRLVELMQGRIGVSSVPGEGCTFWIDLPLAAPASSPAPVLIAVPAGSASLLGASGMPLASAPRAVVLYVEDNPANQELMSQIVGRHDGVRLIMASTGSLGLELAWAHAPDLVLLDIHLPDIDGYTVLARLRADLRSVSLPVVAITANAMPEDVRRVTESGFDDYVPKPIDIQRIDALLLTCLAKRPTSPVALA
jgi:CheY-like chemotaxis protein